MAKGSVKITPRKLLEQFVAENLEEQNYRYVLATQFYAARVLEQTIYTKQLEVGKSIYGKSRKVDFILYHPSLWPECLGIQCRWQSRSGSTEEKLPFDVQCIAQNDLDTIIILDGGGSSAGAKQWLINQSGKNRLKHVFNKEEFSRFASNGKL